MASLMKKKKGTTSFWEIQYWDERKRRKTISLSTARFNEKIASQLKDIVETLLYYRINKISRPEKHVEQWVKSACPEIQEKLVKAKLVDRPSSHTCRELWDAYMKTKTNIKASTLKTYEFSERRFFSHFREDDCIEDITNTQIAEWKTLMLKTLKEATVAGSITKVRCVFNWAVSQGWLEKSPMIGVPRGSFSNPKNDQLVSKEEYLKLLEACPCQEWRTVLALARYGGLRCPSEVMQLRWGDINWAENRFLVRSTKTEHHKGKEARLVPLFPEVRKELTELFFRDETEGKEFVINRFPKREKSNLVTQFNRIVQLAGLLPIKRPYDNMRASRSNEIYAQFGPYYESQWIGHSSKIARDHYLQIRDEDFARASEWIDQSTANKGVVPVRPAEEADLSQSRTPGGWTPENDGG